MELENQRKISVLVYGAGAIGTYVGGSLILAGHEATFIEQTNVIEKINQQGLKLDLSLDERWNIKSPIKIEANRFRCVDSIQSALAQGKAEAIIFAIKSFDTASALQTMLPYKDDLPPIVCLQNGVENEIALSAQLGEGKVITGTTTHSVGRVDVGNIVLEKLRGIGLAPGANPSNIKVATHLVAAMNEANLNAKLFPRGADMKWSKMLTNLLGNATAAILDITPDEVFRHSDLFRLEMGMMREALQVMKAQDIHPVNLPKVPVRLLSWAVFNLPGFIAKPLMVKLVGGGRGGKMPSFHIDLHGGRGRSEVDYLNGAVVRAGEKTGIPTPINRLLNTTLQGMVAGDLAKKDFAQQPEKLLVGLNQ